MKNFIFMFLGTFVCLLVANVAFAYDIPTSGGVVLSMKDGSVDTVYNVASISFVQEVTETATEVLAQQTEGTVVDAQKKEQSSVDAGIVVACLVGYLLLILGVLFNVSSPKKAKFYDI